MEASGQVPCGPSPVHEEALMEALIWILPGAAVVVCLVLLAAGLARLMPWPPGSGPGQP